MNPMIVAQNRTARLVREATTPTYSTSTPAPVAPKVYHMQVVEMDSGCGRYWSKPMRENMVNDYIDRTPPSYSVSDIDHACACWCFDA